jgi:hypothetical protein
MVRFMYAAMAFRCFSFGQGDRGAFLKKLISLPSIQNLAWK